MHVAHKFRQQALVVAPERSAAEAGAAVLAEGGHAIEAMVAAAAMISVTYPHMGGLGGDAFWLIHEPGRPPVALDASGATGGHVQAAYYKSLGHAALPVRGPLAANTVAGTVGGWQRALEYARRWGARLPLHRLLEPAREAARRGHGVTPSLHRSLLRTLDDLHREPGFAQVFLALGAIPAVGAPLPQPALGDTLEQLGRVGLADFYQGETARALARDLARVGSPLALPDLEGYEARFCMPWVLPHRAGLLYNLPPPTQGLVSLAILGILERLDIGALTPGGADHVHAVVEATKQAFRLRDRGFVDGFDRTRTLSAATLDAAAREIRPDRALPWAGVSRPGDTVWMGVVDQAGRAVSYQHSLYHAFGSGVLLSETGVLWQNRGSLFSLEPHHPWYLRPGRKPWHTLNPALVLLKPSGFLIYGAMGGDGQGQTQAALFTRAIQYGQDLATAIAAPRWLLGRTWGAPSDSLKLESRFEVPVVEALRLRGHEIVLLDPFDEATGHAGAIRQDADGHLTGAADPRSDGAMIRV